MLASITAVSAGFFFPRMILFRQHLSLSCANQIRNDGNIFRTSCWRFMRENKQKKSCGRNLTPAKCVNLPDFLRGRESCFLTNALFFKCMDCICLSNIFAKKGAHVSTLLSIAWLLLTRAQRVNCVIRETSHFCFALELFCCVERRLVENDLLNPLNEFTEHFPLAGHCQVQF